MTDDAHQRIETIRRLNDRFRRTFEGGRVVMTAGVQALGLTRLRDLLNQVRTFDSFDECNDPYGEHDFGAFVDEGDKFFFKIDYYDRQLEFGSDDPADPERTTRVLTLMLAGEY